jgi:hypothetical protein
MLEADHEKQLGPKAWNRMVTDYRAYRESLALTENPDAPLEKEYYFDETAGKSLNDHVADLKQQMPEARVQTRRDREGFAVVKVLQAKEYKYDLKKLLEFDPQQSEERLLESLEQIAKATGNSDLESSNPEDVKKVVGALLGGPSALPDIDSVTKGKLRDLA